MTMTNFKKDFPIFTTHPDLVYLDSASSSQTPQVVLDAMEEYYTAYRANIHRGVYDLSAKATDGYESARSTVANFIGALPEEIVFTSGTTHGLNVLASSIGSELGPADNVVLTRMEHHANLIPWQQMSKKYGFELRFIEIENYELRMKNDELTRVIDEHTRVVSVTHVSNSLGTVNPVEEIIAAAKKVGALTIVDAAQSVAHMPIDVKKMDCDALVFSGHKMYGPTGVGVLYAKKSLLERMQPFFYGGDMIKEVSYTNATWHDIPWKFEAGTPNIAGVIGLAAAVQYIERIGFEAILKHEKELTDYALRELQKIDELSIIGPEKSRAGVISFTLKNIHTHDVASILNEFHVAVRAGHHCTMPLMKLLGIPGTTRASFGLCNSKEDVDQLIKGLLKVKKIFM